jgi:hypothetical protein
MKCKYADKCRAYDTDCFEGDYERSECHCFVAKEGKWLPHEK